MFSSTTITTATTITSPSPLSQPQHHHHNNNKGKRGRKRKRSDNDENKKNEVAAAAGIARRRNKGGDSRGVQIDQRCALSCHCYRSKQGERSRSGGHAMRLRWKEKGRKIGYRDEKRKNQCRPGSDVDVEGGNELR
ncbi:hypothetical protein PIB30_042113 [Stylosanthes scabra]|uniref:Uncharacterized protein n=1 Tax=Stylosanthes scabra TaxID=79078 RepID=A0ABU6VI03_9FABA|nr:hypothetical protein [Stylosanthes scabra]